MEESVSLSFLDAGSCSWEVAQSRCSDLFERVGVVVILGGCKVAGWLNKRAKSLGDRRIGVATAITLHVVNQNILALIIARDIYTDNHHLHIQARGLHARRLWWVCV